MNKHEEKVDLRKVSDEANYELRKQVVNMKRAGISNNEVSSIMGINPTQVSRIWNWYKHGGTKALKPKQRGRQKGERCKLTKEQQRGIRQAIIDKTPDQLKLGSCLWTRQSICDYIKREYKVSMTVRSITNYLKAWGLTCQRPTKRAISQDDVRVRDFMEKEYPAIAKRAKEEKAVIYWGDEVGLSNQENYQRGYAPKGQPPVLGVQSKKERINMLSAITNQGKKSKTRFMIFRDSMNQDKLIEFMRRMITDVPEKIFFILDNLKVHHGKRVAKWVEKHKERIELFFLPPYAPELNPDEYLNNALKHSVHSGIRAHTADELESKTQSFMRTLQHRPDAVEKFFHHKNVRYTLCDI